MYVAVMVNPYTTHQDMPVYPDGFAYAGIVSIQNTEQKWPSTAGLTSEQLSPMKVLENSSW
jgi:hypothetical protein